MIRFAEYKAADLAKGLVSSPIQCAPTRPLHQPENACWAWISLKHSMVVICCRYPRLQLKHANRGTLNNATNLLDLLEFQYASIDWLARVVHKWDNMLKLETVCVLRWL